MGLKNGSVFFTDKHELESFSLSNQFAEHMEFFLVKDKFTAQDDDAYYALSLSVRDRLVRRWLRTQQQYKELDVKRVYYLSLEFLMGRLLGDALINLDFYKECHNILGENGYNLEEIREFEPDMGLGNGGLGRLAACYLDSMATLGLPAFGYGIRYQFGIFQQKIEKGYQIEKADNWVSYGNPWEILRRKLTYRVKLYGRVETTQDQNGEPKFNWVDTEDVLAVGWDIPIPGYGANTVNNLRLWESRATSEFNFDHFNSGQYLKSVEEKNNSENISKVLYPNDNFAVGKVLRLKQQYFFVSATLQDIIRKYKIHRANLNEFSFKTAIQLNDTHPAIAIPELMRILLDEEGFGWEKAWEITQNTFAYTNHTVVPEALEEWAVALIEEMLPRHLQIIYEINQRFLDEVKKKYTNDPEIIAEVSLIREHPTRTVRMANVAIVGSHSINGVARLHTEILKKELFKHFYKIYPNKFKNVTNGITPRRWLKTANPSLAGLITERIGKEWVTDLTKLKKLEKFVDNEEFREIWKGSKWLNKKLLVDYIKKENRIIVNPESIFDVQIKRFHQYKRQLLNVLHVITMYNKLKDNPDLDMVPRTVMFGGKAAPAYFTAKLVIKLINNVADVINNDESINNKLKVIFIKNYSVSLAEKIIPASDLSEQISTAGFEASGTGNMKFALNGALTIGTMDGANIEIREEVGEENIFIFGLHEEEIVNLKRGNYNPKEYYEKNKDLKRVIDMIASEYFNPDEPGIFEPLIEELLNADYYCLFADYASYVETQDKVSKLYLDQDAWTKKAILNVARMGKFSSDRSVKEYAEKIWKVNPVKVSLDR
jgi:glycogen phosphorylase